jgi:hypothetical protein
VIREGRYVERESRRMSFELGSGQHAMEYFFDRTFVVVVVAAFDVLLRDLRLG